MEKITAETMIADIIKIRPDAAEILARHGMHCIGCSIAASENLGAAAQSHGADLDQILEDLNE